MLCLYQYGPRSIARLHVQCCATLYHVTRSNHHLTTYISDTSPLLQRTAPVFMNSRTSTPMLGYRTRTITTTPSLLQDSNSLTTEQKILLAKAEYELYKEEGEDMPSQVTDESWEQLAAMHSPLKRAKYFRYLFVTEKKIENDRTRQKKKREYSLEYRAKVTLELNLDNAHISYGLWRNSIFTKWNNRRMNNINHHRLMNAKMYGQHIVFDNSFDAHMTMQEKSSLAKQFAESFGINRDSVDPFYIHLCNFDVNTQTSKKMLSAIPTMLSNIFPLAAHTENYLDMFPKEQLVYLTPHCRQELIEYDHNAVYVIANIVNRGTGVPLTLAKAKKENIKMAKLPLDRYLDWGQGSKELTLNQIMRIMLDVKLTGDWKKAFDKSVPKRKLMKPQFAETSRYRRR